MKVYTRSQVGYLKDFTHGTFKSGQAVAQDSKCLRADEDLTASSSSVSSSLVR